MKKDAQKEMGIELKQITPEVNERARVYVKTQNKNISSISILKKMGNHVKTLIAAKDPLNVAKGRGLGIWNEKNHTAERRGGVTKRIVVTRE